ncbi:SLC13 family permease, partial [Thermomonas sp.]|uniref:SLC13 family permease n=1 Tax=Thermomonas sp. TaxID=1971895 RepID=UPI00262B783E
MAALMLPVVIEVARRTEVPASRLLMPMLFGTLLGGLTTLIATAPNLLASDALASHGERPFTLFDFFPVGAGAFITGTLFIAFIGRRFLPERDPGGESQHRSQRNLRAQYGLQERTFTMRVPHGSVLVGKTLAQSRIGTAAGLIVVALERDDQVITLPSRNTPIAAGDRLLVQGRLDRFDELRRWSGLAIEREAPVLQELLAERIRLLEVCIAEDSALVKDLLHHGDFRRRFAANVVAIRRGTLVRRTNLNYVPLRAGDHLLLQGSDEALSAIRPGSDFDSVGEISEVQLLDSYRMQERAFIVRVPDDSGLGGTTLARSRLGDAFDFRLLAIFREGTLHVMPEPDALILGGDLLLIQGRPEDLDVLRGLQELEVSERVAPQLNIFESDRLATVEVALAPNSPLAGKRVATINLREKYGLELVAIWRSGGAIRTDLDAQELHFGDALLLLGPRAKLALLRDDPDLIVLTPLGPVVANRQRAPVAAALMLLVVALAFSGWLPISVAAILGATLMVSTGCLTMEQA